MQNLAPSQPKPFTPKILIEFLSDEWLWNSCRIQFRPEKLKNIKDYSLSHLLYSSTSTVQRLEISRVQNLEISRLCTLEISRCCTVEVDK